MADSRFRRFTVCAGVAGHLRQQGGARDIAVLFALRHTQVRQNHARILFERQLTASRRVSLRGAGSWAKAWPASASNIGILSFMPERLHPECQIFTDKCLFSHGLLERDECLSPYFGTPPASCRIALRLVVRYTHTMSKRLQVLLADDEMADIQTLAKLRTIDRWRMGPANTSRSAQTKSVRDPAVKLAAIRRAVEYNFPTADIDQMLREIEQGRQS